MSDEFFVDNNSETELQDWADEASKVNRFPVRTQLALLGLLLFFIFAGVVVPKSLALLHTPDNPTALPAASGLTTEDSEVSSITLASIPLTARAAFVLDVKTGEVLLEKNADEVLPLASITKLMTTLVAYELIDGNTPITVSKAAADQQSGGPLNEGETFKARDLADFALISSYNSAAYTLASGVGELLGEKDPVTQFVAAMNITAKELNLNSLSYKNPTGLDTSASQAGAFGSARDTSHLMKHILVTHPAILAPTLAEHTRLYAVNGGYHDAHNTNTSLNQIPNLLGSKTGYTDLAGGNLTIAFDAGFNRPIIITVLGSTYDARFTDVEKIVAAIEKSLTPSE